SRSGASIHGAGAWECVLPAVPKLPLRSAYVVLSSANAELWGATYLTGHPLMCKLPERGEGASKMTCDRSGRPRMESPIVLGGYRDGAARKPSKRRNAWEKRV